MSSCYGRMKVLPFARHREQYTFLLHTSICNHESIGRLEEHFWSRLLHAHYTHHCSIATCFNDLSYTPLCSNTLKLMYNLHNTPASTCSLVAKCHISAWRHARRVSLHRGERTCRSPVVNLPAQINNYSSLQLYCWLHVVPMAPQSSWWILRGDSSKWGRIIFVNWPASKSLETFMFMRA